MRSRDFFLILLTPIFLAGRVAAHCPLCTLGAAAAAGGALWLGVNTVVVSLFIGAFAVSMGWWISRLIKKKYIPFQKTILILASFALTIIPILPIISSQTPFMISWMGGYGSLLNRTYMIDMALVGSFVGGLIVLVSGGVSSKVTKLRGKHVSFQRIIVTFVLLVVAGLIAQFAF